MDQEFELYTPAKPKKRTTSKNYPAIKIVAMIMGIISAGLFTYYAADFATQYFMQIAQYKEMGMEIPAATLNTIYFQIALTFAIGVLPLVGSVLPNKFNKCAIMLVSSSITWGIVNTLPSIIVSFSQGATFADLISLFVMCGASVFALVSAILHIATPVYEKEEPAEEVLTYVSEDSEFYAEAEADAEEAEEATEEVVEEAVEEAVEETTEEIVEEAAEETQE